MLTHKDLTNASSDTFMEAQPPTGDQEQQYDVPLPAILAALQEALGPNDPFECAAEEVT